MALCLECSICDIGLYNEKFAYGRRRAKNKLQKFSITGIPLSLYRYQNIKIIDQKFKISKKFSKK